MDDSGGGIDGMINFCRDVGAVGPDGIIIPGHGPVTDTATLSRYMLKRSVLRAQMTRTARHCKRDGRKTTEVLMKRMARNGIR